MAKKLDKKELKKPDSFQELFLQIGEQITENAPYFVALGVVALLVSASFIGWNWYHDSHEMRAQQALFPVEKAYMAKEDGFKRAESQPPPHKANSKEKSKVESPNLPMATGNLDQDYGSEVSGFKAVIAQYPKTRAAVLAALDLAEIYTQYHQPATALQELDLVKGNLGAKDLLRGILLMKTANIQSVKGDCESAVKTWDQVLDQSSFAFFHPDASLRSAVCFEQLNNIARARELYQKTRQQYPDTPAAQSAQKFLQLMEMKHPAGHQGPS